MLLSKYSDFPREFNDDLNFRLYAKAIAYYILNSETPTTIALTASWGYGKSTIMNLIKLYLDHKYFSKVAQENTEDFDNTLLLDIQKFYEDKKEEDLKSFTTISFNSWIFFNTRDVGENLFQQIVIELTNKASQDGDLGKKTAKTAKDILSKAYKLLKAVKINGEIDTGNGKIGAEFQLPELFDEEITLSNVKTEFEDFVGEILGKNSNNNLLVIIDDIDRLYPKQAIETITFIKNFLDVKRCVFLVATDNEVIEAGIKEIYGNDKELFETKKKDFFDKIYQLTFKIPELSELEIENYILSFDIIRDYFDLLKKRQPQKIEEQKLELLELMKEASKFNPRYVKKIVNLYRLWDRIFIEKFKQDDLSDIDDRFIVVLELMLFFQLEPNIFIELKKYCLQEESTEQILHELNERKRGSTENQKLYFDNLLQKEGSELFEGYRNLIIKEAFDSFKNSSNQNIVNLLEKTTLTKSLIKHKETMANYFSVLTLPGINTSSMLNKLMRELGEARSFDTAVRVSLNLYHYLKENIYKVTKEQANYLTTCLIRSLKASGINQIFSARRAPDIVAEIYELLYNNGLFDYLTSYDSILEFKTLLEEEYSKDMKIIKTVNVIFKAIDDDLPF